MTEVFDSTPRQTSGDVLGLGPCTVRRPTLAVERVLAVFYESDKPDEGAYVEALLSHTTLSPRLSYDDVAALAPEARMGLRELIGSVCELSPTSASSDSALLTAMGERQHLLIHRAQATAGDFSRWLSEVVGGLRERAHAAARGPDTAAIVERWTRRLAEAGERAQAVLDFKEQQPLGFVVAEVHLEESFELLLAVAEHGDELMVATLESALVTPEFVELVRTAVEQPGLLDASQQEELGTGLELVLQRRWAAACRLLMGATEGMVWDAARREQVVNSSQQMLKTAHPRRPQPRRASSVNGLLDEQCGLNLEDDLRLFLHAQLWDGRAHDLRHGRVRGGERAYALWSLIALCALLDRERGARFMHEVADRIDAAVASPAASSA